VLQTWIVVVVLVGLSIWAQNKFRTWEPRSWQVAIEWVVEYIEDMVQDVGGRSLPDAIPYLVTMISFVCIANLLGLLPIFQAPTRDLNTTLALSFISLGSTYYFAIRKRGVLGWLKSFAEPVFIMLPLNIMGQLSRVLSMALRLFGNVIAGEMIGGVIFLLLPVLAPLPFNLLGMLTSVLQALVFTVLTFVFVIDALGSQEETAIAGQEAAQQAGEA
jgi:F-type H+-transporting ATPase subunit a